MLKLTINRKGFIELDKKQIPNSDCYKKGHSSFEYYIQISYNSNKNNGLGNILDANGYMIDQLEIEEKISKG